ncbi:unnamed protein product [Leptosia nina]|uniref:EF-hand domain-containing protein n=1 Tax=Leptosia nina TaxID=320188 RepID=A0AAV1J8V2_9NEOP
MFGAAPVILLVLMFNATMQLAPNLCEKYPERRYCIIEWMSRERWAHSERYTYKWDRKKCLLIRWADYCGAPLPNTNNFESEEQCYSECGGVFKRFREVNPEVIPKSMTDNQAHTIVVPVEEIEKLPELKENPFKRRICQVFSHDSSGNLTFEDFLDMMSVFSEAAPRDIKAWYAFRIYDLDDDKYIGREDLLEATKLLTAGQLQESEREEIVTSVLDEADVDGDGRLSFMDFEHVVARAPDFVSTFHIRV